MFEQLILREANENDLPAIIAMLNDDILGKTRENPTSLTVYEKAFNEIKTSNNIQLMVVELYPKHNAENQNSKDINKEIIATCQLIEIPCLAYQGMKRLEVESVRVKANYRNQGVGTWLIKQIITIAKAKDCKMLQLTTNKVRLDAQKFYLRLGFVDSHIGMKKYL